MLEISILADDAKIFEAIYSLADTELLQNELDSFKNWCVLNGMILSTTKCKLITFSNKKESNLITLNYSLEELLKELLSKILECLF